MRPFLPFCYFLGNTNRLAMISLLFSKLYDLLNVFFSQEEIPVNPEVVGISSAGCFNNDCSESEGAVTSCPNPCYTIWNDK